MSKKRQKEEQAKKELLAKAKAKGLEPDERRTFVLQIMAVVAEYEREEKIKFDFAKAMHEVKEANDRGEILYTNI